MGTVLSILAAARLREGSIEVFFVWKVWVSYKVTVVVSGAGEIAPYLCDMSVKIIWGARQLSESTSFLGRKSVIPSLSLAVMAGEKSLHTVAAF